MGDVIDFRSRTKPSNPPPAEQALHRSTRRALPAARGLAAQQSAEQRKRYATAQARQEREKLLATGKVVPGRITLALDVRGLEGPEVDIACGAAEPDVDDWELGVSTPTPDQVVKLAELTGYPVTFFYKPLDPMLMTTFICSNSGPKAERCRVIETDGIPVPPAAGRGPTQTTLF